MSIGGPAPLWRRHWFKLIAPEKFGHRYYCITTEVFLDCIIRKMDSTDKHDSNFGNLCMKKGGSFQSKFSFFFLSPMGGRV